MYVYIYETWFQWFANWVNLRDEQIFQTSPLLHLCGEWNLATPESIPRNYLGLVLLLPTHCACSAPLEPHHIPTKENPWLKLEIT